MKILITGGAGFIGTAVVEHFLREMGDEVINGDKLSYAGSIESIERYSDNENYCFEQVDICNIVELQRVFETHQPHGVVHLAAETHVDRSIENPIEFLNTNVIGTYNLLQVSRDHWQSLNGPLRDAFRFLHVSTDEVFGELGIGDEKFTETTPYAPSSPYSASKASSDHLVRAWHRTYELPVLISNCSNNYGPGQFPEKLIPLMIANALQGAPLPIYGSGNQIRDWLFVEDHAKALTTILSDGQIGETYNIGGKNEKTNLDVVRQICAVLDETIPTPLGGIRRYEELIVNVDDRPGHDFRYAIDTSKISTELGWQPIETFETGLQKTIEWYLQNPQWLKKNKSNSLAEII